MVLYDFLSSLSGWDPDDLWSIRELEQKIVNGGPVEENARRIFSFFTSSPRPLTSDKFLARDPAGIGDLRLNQRGLHVARIVLANYAAQRYFRTGTPLLGDGLIVIPNFVDSTDALALALSEIDQIADWREARAPGNEIKTSTLQHVRNLVASYVLAWVYPGAADVPNVLFRTSFVQKLRVDSEKFDEQTVLHSDTFFPAVKWWWFPRAVELKHGPLIYVPGSPILTPALLQFYHEQAIDVCLGRVADWRGRGQREGSFRISNDELERVKLWQRPVEVAADTLVIANVFGFHARGRPLGTAERVALHGSIRVDHPFKEAQ